MFGTECHLRPGVSLSQAESVGKVNEIYGIAVSWNGSRLVQAQKISGGCLYRAFIRGTGRASAPACLSGPTNFRELRISFLVRDC